MVDCGLQTLEVGSPQRVDEIVGQPIRAMLAAPRRAEGAPGVKGQQRAAVFDAGANLLGDAVVARAWWSLRHPHEEQRGRHRPDHVRRLVDLTTRRKFSRMRFPCSVPMDSGWNCTP